MAISLCGLHQQGVKLIVECFIRRQVLVKEVMRGGVIRPGRKKSMPRKNPSRIGVRNKCRVPPGIEQNCVGGFRPDPFEGQKLGAGAIGFLSEQRG